MQDGDARSRNVKYTQVAAKALGLVELFQASFADGLDGPIRYRVELAAPDGPSTAGGKQALQHIKLVPELGGPTLVIGSADLVKQIAEIRTFEHMVEMHAQRFKGQRVPLDMRKYRELTGMLSNFFASMRIQVKVVDVDAVPRAPAAGGGTSPLTILLGVVVGVVVVLALAAAFVMARR